MNMQPPAEFGDPVMIVLSTLVNGWDAGETVLDDAPEIHTGAYQRDGKHPALAVGFDADEGPVSGGETGYSATDGRTGKGMQRLSGYVMIDAVAGSRAECNDVGPNGEQVNPKTVRWSLYQHATDLFVSNQQPGDLHSLAPRGGKRLVDKDGTDPVYRMQFRGVYTRDRVPSA